MKKIFMFIFVATLATFGISCSSDDNSTDDKKEEKQLVLKADKLEVKVGEAVNFSAELDNKKIDGVKILINDQPGSLKHVFKEAGTFKVVATKAGYRNSNPINVVVTENANKIILKADKSKVEVGEKVTFTAQAGGADLKDFKVSFADGTEINGTSWIADKAGSFKFFAFKEGLENSDNVEITVTAKPIDLKLTLVTNPNEVFAGKPFTLSIVTGNTPVKDAVLHVDGEALNILSDDNGEFNLYGPAGTVTFSAEFEGSFSNGVEVTIKEAEKVEAKGKGSFEFNGATHQIEDSYLVFFGLEYADESKTEVVARWQVEVGSGDLAAVYVFKTPAKKVSEGSYSPDLPNATNTTPLIAGVIRNGSTIGVSNLDMKFKFDAQVNAKNLFEGHYKGTTAPMNDKPFSIEYEGESYFFDASENSANKTRSTSRFVEANQKVKSNMISKFDRTIRTFVK
ncbi:hypothetical protein GJV76_13195 [Myroides sp. BIT-d1]|uniref:Uncharacterized protein n=1 Tax=Myroides albus TaxID=2562892 RepID=A0A6I3LMY3_9FLAO|nr:hypothetical protein [Myroides albus]MTG99077.1 hypothetical protein [Myroides albus]